MAKEYFAHQVEQSVNVVTLHLPEALDVVEFDRINEQVLRLIDGRTGQSWLIDLSAVNYMGSAMLGLLVNLRQRIKAGGGQLELSSLSPQLVEVFRTCCLERLFTIRRTRAEALTQMNAARH
jgi:anti-anti-sigma factor